MQVAQELFYQQGFKGTGINEVIGKSGVAKATFYNHFPTKDELGHAYIRAMKEAEMAYMDQAVAAQQDPVERFLSLIESLEPWLVATDYRGCPFINLASEVPNAKSPMRKEGIAVYDYARDRVRQLASELIASDRKKYAHLDAEQLTNDYMTVFVGAIALAEIYHAIWPVEHALQAVRRMIGT